jgi:hypothetical protein
MMKMINGQDDQRDERLRSLAPDVMCSNVLARAICAMTQI